MRYTSDNLLELSWPYDRLTEAMEWLARSSRLIPVTAKAKHNTVLPALEGADWQQQVELTASTLGIEAEPVSCTYGKLDDFFRNAAPAIVPLLPPGKGGPVQFLVLKKNGRRCTLLSPGLLQVRVKAELVVDVFSQPLSAQFLESANTLLRLANIPAGRQEKVGKALVGTWLGRHIIPVGWMLRPSPAASLFVQVRHSKIVSEILWWLGAFVLQTVLVLLGWWLIGRVVLDEQTDRGWVSAWVLLLISVIPFQLLGSWMQNSFSKTLSVIFKQRLLYGALKMNPDDIRHMGSGQLLERVMESESFEMLAMGGGLTALIAVLQLGSAAWVLAQGVGGLLSVAALGIWFIAILIAGWVNYGSGREWTDTYRKMTNGLVEKMVGHRTRLAQEDPAHRHEEEDVELEHYQALTRYFSRTGTFLNAIPSSWLLVGLACFIPSVISSQPAQLTGMALGLGGVLLAHQAFGVIQAGIQNDIMLLLSWQQVKPIYQAAAQPEEIAAVVIKSSQPHDPGVPDPVRRIPLITAQELTYRFSPQRCPALVGCNLEIFSGDRIILEGSSGGGKTTLGAVLAGLRKPDSGLLFLHGYDRQSLGENAWRKRVVMAPQFHENYVFNETFAFNLLMGRRWPAQEEDLQAAAEICNELGLGDLLARMPSGWQQMIGENGWQLSHGERSRVFIARALLQNADLVIMDESFGALDPENLRLALECARRRAATLLIIAHP